MLLCIGVGGACGALFAVGSGPIFFTVSAFALMTQSMILAAFWKGFWGCVYFGMGIGFLVGLGKLSIPKRKNETSGNIGF